MEALKIWTGFSKRLDNYFMYMGHEGIYSSNTEFERVKKCEMCSKHVEIIKVDENEIWENIIDKIILSGKIKSNLEFSIFHNNKYVYKVYKENKDDSNVKIESELDENKTIKELVDAGLIKIKKIFEIIPSDDIKNVSKVKLKRPQDFEEEE